MNGQERESVCIEETGGERAGSEYARPCCLAEAGVFLGAETARMVEACRRPGARGKTLFLPQAGSQYDAFRLRDFAYMLEGGIAAFKEAELRDALQLMLDAQAPDGAFPDCVRLDGTPVYKPGMGTMGERPVIDGAHFMVDAVWCAFRHLGDHTLIERNVPRLVKGLQGVPRNAKTDLVYIDPTHTWERCGYGFTDSVRTSGDVLFPSLLHVQACQQLADLLQSLGRDGDADMWRAESQHVAKRIRMYFWDKKPGLFKAATACCREHDLWGSAFAVYLNVATSGQLIAIAKYFQTHYEDIVRNGHLRHLPAGEYWEKTETARGTHQNGAFWAVPSGWLAYTLDIVNPELADRTVVDLAGTFATDGIWECVDEDGTPRVRDYVASAAMPAAGVRHMLARREKRHEQTIFAEM